MFSILPTSAHTYNQPYYYPPAVSSPLSSSPLRRSLSPRDPNVITTRASPDKVMTSPTPTSRAPITPSTSALSSRESAYSRRVTKANPLIHGRSGSTGADGRETRRKLFLKRVREDSEDKRWKVRGGDDEMMRYIWIAEQRRREERQRTEAMRLDAPVEEEEFLSLDEIMADEVALMEEAELEALIANQIADGGQAAQQDMPAEDEMDSLPFRIDKQAPQTQASRVQQRTDTPYTPYGSDDDEYDHIFMNVIQEENRVSSQLLPPTDQDQDMMDMS